MDRDIVGNIYTLAQIQGNNGQESVFIKHSYLGSLLAIQHHDEYFNSMDVGDNYIAFAGEYTDFHDGAFPNSTVTLPPAETYNRAFIATADFNGNIIMAETAEHRNPTEGDSRATKIVIGRNDELIWGGEFRSNVIIYGDTLVADNTSSFIASHFLTGSYSDWVTILPSIRR